MEEAYDKALHFTCQVIRKQQSKDSGAWIAMQLSLSQGSWLHRRDGPNLPVNLLEIALSYE
jgi:hypothetical protein